MTATGGGSSNNSSNSGGSGGGCGGLAGGGSGGSCGSDCDYAAATAASSVAAAMAVIVATAAAATRISRQPTRIHGRSEPGDVPERSRILNSTRHEFAMRKRNSRLECFVFISRPEIEL